MKMKPEYHFNVMLNSEEKLSHLGIRAINIKVWYAKAVPTTNLERTLPLTVIFTLVEKKTIGNQT